MSGRGVGQLRPRISDARRKAEAVVLDAAIETDLAPPIIARREQTV
jgi:hypothetical protein